MHCGRAWRPGGCASTVALGAVAAPLLIEALGIRGALLATALVVPLVVIARWRATQRLDARVVVPERALQALREIDLFAPLPLATVETLAVHAAPRAVLAGEPIVHVGEVGSTFYVIADGVCEAEAGPITRRLERGDYFGEIACCATWRARPRCPRRPTGCSTSSSAGRFSPPSPVRCGRRKRPRRSSTRGCARRADHRRPELARGPGTFASRLQAQRAAPIVADALRSASRRYGATKSP